MTLFAPIPSRFQLRLVAAVAATLLFVGCAPSLPELLSGQAVGPEFNPSRGLYVPEETRRSLGVEIADVTERPIGPTLEFTVRVFHAGPDGSRATALVPAALAGRLSPGVPVEIRVAPDTRISGRLAGPGKPLSSTGMAELLVECEGRIEPGSFVSARVEAVRSDAVTAVPRSAVVDGAAGPFVYVVSGEHFVRTPVRLGAAVADAVEIAEGLYPGDRVVSAAAMSLWLTELAAVKGGQACCVLPPKGK